jgi:glycosyltransferase involved in cell wall biosynthesis
MRIGIDLTSLPVVKGGVGFYLLELIGALATVDSASRYVLLTREDHRRELAARAPSFEHHAFRLNSRPRRLAWEQLSLPGVARRLHLDVLHSPHYTRPLTRLSCASVVGIMDMTLFLLPEYHVWEKRVFFQRVIPAAVRRADRLIAISESTKRDVQRHLNVPAERIDVTPLAVSAEYRPDVPSERVSTVRRRYELPERFVLYVGRLEPRKNLPRLLDAYCHVMERLPDAPALVLAGASGWHPAELNRRLARLGTRVRTLGYVSDDALPALYAAATVFVYPSLYEGFGIPVLEALSCGVPTITSSTSSMPEVAGDAALLVDPMNTDALAQAIERLLRDQALQARLRATGPKRAAAFSWQRTAALTVQSYMKAHDDWRRDNAS